MKVLLLVLIVIMSYVHLERQRLWSIIIIMKGQYQGLEDFSGQFLHTMRKPQYPSTASRTIAQQISNCIFIFASRSPQKSLSASFSTRSRAANSPVSACSHPATILGFLRATSEMWRRHHCPSVSLRYYILRTLDEDVKDPRVVLLVRVG